MIQQIVYAECQQEQEEFKFKFKKKSLIPLVFRF
jgi:hypothetical protein